MMSKLNLFTFLNDLSHLPLNQRHSDEPGVSYLLDKVLLPLLADQTVWIADLDFDAFDQNCIRILMERCEQADNNRSELVLYQQAVHTRPAVRANCDFV